MGHKVTLLSVVLCVQFSLIDLGPFTSFGNPRLDEELRYVHSLSWYLRALCRRATSEYLEKGS